MSVSTCSSASRGSKAAGDQGTEYYIRDWYSYPWDCVLYYEGERANEVNALAAKYARNAANNQHIGYSQSDRYSMWTMLNRYGLNPSSIQADCNADCSSSTTFIFKAIGYELGIEKLKDLDLYLWTGNMKKAFVNAGFSVYDDSKWTESPDYLKKGAVLLNEKYHVVINLDDGKYASDGTPSTGHSTLRKGSKGSEVKELQSMLIYKGYSCGVYGVDGDFGSATESAAMKFQSDNGLEVDGIVGPITWNALENGGGSSTWKVKVNTPSGINVRKSPSASSERIDGVYNGEVYTASKEQNGFTYIDEKGGWCASKYLLKV